MSHFFPVPEPFCGPKICLKSVCGRGSAPDPARAAHDAPPDPLVGWGGDTHPHTLLPSAPRSSRLRLSPVSASICAPHKKSCWRSGPPLFFDKSNTDPKVPFSITFNPDFNGTPLGLFDVEYLITIRD